MTVLFFKMRILHEKKELHRERLFCYLIYLTSGLIRKVLFQFAQNLLIHANVLQKYELSAPMNSAYLLVWPSCRHHIRIFIIITSPYY